MKRFVMDQLVLWKEKENRKPLTLFGVRQSGKTWLMKEFGRTHFAKTAYISFYRNDTARDIFEHNFNIERIIMALSIAADVDITPNDTLIILDEIQDAPRAVEALKYFCEEAPEYAVIAAGSLLGVALHEGISFPVGKVDMLNIYPLSFREFLVAMDESKLADLLTTKDYTLIDAFHDEYIFWLKQYYYVGGMPEVVEYFRTHKTDYRGVRERQNIILRQYRGDFGKHINENQLPRINMVWDSIPMQLAKENKKFFFGQIKKGARSSEFEMAIQWLTDCGLVYKIHRVNKPSIPLKAYIDFSAYKLFVVDVGLLGALADVDAESIIDGNSIFVEFKGAMAEQYVVQQLISDTTYNPYYYTSEKGTYEMDFMVQKGRNVVPIEVKAETNLQSKSLKVYCKKYEPEYAVRTSTAHYMEQDKLTNLPLYSIMNL